MIVWLLIGIGVCVLVLCSSDGNNAADEGDTMTNAQIAQMLRDDETDRRRVRVEQGRSIASYSPRVPHKRHTDTKGNKGNSRARGWDV